MELPNKDRAALAERLISSLEAKADPQVELAWQREVDLRLRQVRTGKVKTIPWETVHAKLRKGKRAVGLFPSRGRPRT
jgi:putative addiction module component (TIGR02574 family)